MVINTSRKQSFNGFSNSDKILVDYILMLSQLILPNNTSKFNIKEFSPSKLLYKRYTSRNRNYLKIFHMKFNNNFSISIYLEVKASLYSYGLYSKIAHCWKYRKNYYNIRFAIKKRIRQKYNLYDDFNIVISFLKDNNLYQDFYVELEKKCYP